MRPYYQNKIIPKSFWAMIKNLLVFFFIAFAWADRNFWKGKEKESSSLDQNEDFSQNWTPIDTFVTHPQLDGFCYRNIKNNLIANEPALFSDVINIEKFHKDTIDEVVQIWQLAISKEKIMNPMDLLRNTIQAGFDIDSFLKQNPNLPVIKLPSDSFSYNANVGTHILKQGGKAAETLKKLLQPSGKKILLECASANSLFHYSVILNFLNKIFGDDGGDKLFNEFFGNGLIDFPVSQSLIVSEYATSHNVKNMEDITSLRFPYISPLNFFIKIVTCDGKELDNCSLPIGTQVYFENHKSYLKKHYAGHYQGINASYMGVNSKNEKLFWSVDFNGLKTIPEIKKILVDSYNAEPDTLDIKLAELAKVNLKLMHPWIIGSKDIESYEVFSLDLEKLEALASDPKQVLKQYKKYLTESNKKLTADRDKLFIEGTLPTPLVEKRLLPLDKHFYVTDTDLKELAKYLNFRFVSDKKKHKSFVISPYYEIFLQVDSSLGRKGQQKIYSQYADIQIYRKIFDLPSDLKKSFSPLIQKLSTLVDEDRENSFPELTLRH